MTQRLLFGVSFYMQHIFNNCSVDLHTYLDLLIYFKNYCTKKQDFYSLGLSLSVRVS